MLTPMLFSVVTTAELICMSETKRQQHSIPERKKKFYDVLCIHIIASGSLTVIPWTMQ